MPTMSQVQLMFTHLIIATFESNHPNLPLLIPISVAVGSQAYALYDQMIMVFDVCTNM